MLKTKSIESSGIIASERPSLVWYVIDEQSSKRFLQLSMHFCDRSTTVRRSHRSFRNWVQRPKPGAISRMLPAGTKGRIRGSRDRRHCMAGPP